MPSSVAQTEDARSMANRILGTPLFRPPVAVPLTVSRQIDVRPSPLDWATEWLRNFLPLLSLDMRRRLVLATISKRDIGRTLTSWEREIARAWDDAVRQEREGR